MGLGKFHINHDNYKCLGNKFFCRMLCMVIVCSEKKISYSKITEGKKKKDQLTISLSLSLSLSISRSLTPSQLHGKEYIMLQLHAC